MYELAQSARFFSDFSASDLTFLAEAAGRTLLISVLSVSIGTVLGCVFGWLLSVSRWAGAVTLGLILDAFRSVPLIIQLILFFNFFPIIGFPVKPARWSPRSRAAASKPSRSRRGARRALLA
jgi:polar amino acid transport system permease protein